MTGASGFVGRHLVQKLKDKGESVHVLPRQPEGDICHPACFKKLTPLKIKAVYHLAAESYVPDSWIHARRFYEINVLGTQNVLEFCREKGAKMIFLSSYIYGNPAYLPIDENHPVSPNNPYSHSKWLAEEMCRFYVEYYGLSVSILRPFNIYGPGQKDHFLIPHLLKQMSLGQKMSVHDSRPKRDYVYVSDFVEACLAVNRVENRFGIYNVGSGVSISVKEIIELIQEIKRQPLDWEDSHCFRKNEIMDVVASCSLEKSGVWKPLVSFREGLRQLMTQAPL